MNDWSLFWAAIASLSAVAALLGAGLYHFVKTTIMAELKKTAHGNGKQTTIKEVFTETVRQELTPILTTQVSILKELQMSHRDIASAMNLANKLAEYQMAKLNQIEQDIRTVR